MKQILMDKDPAFKVLKNTKTFQYLGGEELDNLYRFCRFVQFGKGEKIIGENEVNPNLYVIARGSVNVMIHEGEKNDVFLSSIGEGDIFGEAALFINMKRTADVYALEDTELIEMERNGLLSYFKLFPIAGVKVLMVITYSLLLKLRESHLQLAFDRKSFINQEEVDDLMKALIG